VPYLRNYWFLVFVLTALGFYLELENPELNPNLVKPENPVL
jgi:hypothetical protein